MCQLCLNLRFDGRAVDRHARKLGDDLFDRLNRIGLDFGERLHLCGTDATGGGIELRGQRGVAGLQLGLGAGNRPRLGFAESDGRRGTRGFEPRLIIALGGERSSARRLRRSDVPRNPAVTIFDRRLDLGDHRLADPEIDQREYDREPEKLRGVDLANLGKLRHWLRSLLLT